MCDMIDSHSAEKISRMKKLRRTLSESFGRIALKKEDSSFDERAVTQLNPSEVCSEVPGVRLCFQELLSYHLVVPTIAGKIITSHGRAVCFLVTFFVCQKQETGDYGTLCSDVCYVVMEKFQRSGYG
ncbi:hypothetical protein Q9233_003161 [Columba guinea]|nr:hypothetical protein Q9233_003161 [Columba guinea]